MAVFGWMQGQIEADAWFANGRSLQVGLQGVKIEGTTYDHMTWAFAYCWGYPTARMALVAGESGEKFKLQLDLPGSRRPKRRLCGGGGWNPCRALFGSD